jgi:uncharacterized membrane protein YfcA
VRAVTLADLALLFGAGIVAGLLSVVVSVASIASYPALLAVGVPPLAANVTNTIALVFTAIGAAAGSRPELAGQAATVRRLAVLTTVGGAAGAALLLLTPATWFTYVVPWLIAGAALVVLLRRKVAEHPGPAGRWRYGGVVGAGAYIGYFGAAGGIMLLAVLRPLLDLPFVRTNAVKNAISGFANGTAALAFVLFGPVRWAAVPPLAIGFLLGGWAGPSVVRRIPEPVLRWLVGIGGIAIAIRFGWTAYR